MSIKSALISVFHKDGIDELALELAKNNVKIYSTGGTKSHLEKLGLEVHAVENETNYPEVFGGRVKTLHPAIFGGILYRRENENDLLELEKHGIPSIDLIVVDLYPFEDTVSSGASHADIIEKIDIGGISLIRAAAKNYEFTSIISSRSQYSAFTKHYKESGDTTLEFQKQLALEAFQVTRDYDTAISSYFTGEDLLPLRYGENPHQKAHFTGSLSKIFEKLGGKELSYNNLLDIDAAVALISDISESDMAAFAILKHNNACGCSQRDTVHRAFQDALASDPVSAFGGILISDKEIGIETAKEIDKIFYEVCIAPSFTEEASELLLKKSKRILLKWNREDFTQPIVRSCLNGVLVQERDSINAVASGLTCATKLQPSSAQVDDLLFAEKLVKNTKSNAIILVKNRSLISSGTGQTSRVDALNQAIHKAKTFGFNLTDAVLASDAFFPFPDCVEIGASVGVSAVIQPGGSIKDQLSIDKANELGISMVFTGVRHFKH